MSDFILSILSQVIGQLVTDKIEVNLSNVFSRFEGKGLRKNKQIYSNFLSEINSKGEVNKSDINKLIKQPKYSPYFYDNYFYNTNFSKRLDYIMFLINRCNMEINREKLAEYLGFSSVNKINRYYLSNLEPTFEMETFIAKKLGIDPNWMKSQNNGLEESHPFLLTTNLDEIFDTKGKYFFAISQCDRPYIQIIKKVDSYKYLTYFPYYPFFSEVGGGGKSQLLELLQVLERASRQEIGALQKVVYLTKKEFFDISDGKEYPGIVEKVFWQYGSQYILEDFVNPNILNELNCEELYGKEFVATRKLINKL